MTGLPMPILRIPVPAAVQKKKLERVREHLRGALGDLDFPASRWELVIGSENYGADWRTRQVLRGLPDHVFEDLNAVVRSVECLGLSPDVLGR